MAKNAIIYDTVFIPFRLGRLARQIGAHETTFGNWARGTSAMPATKELQLAEVLTKQVEKTNRLIEYLISSAHAKSKRPRTNKGLANAWSKGGAAPHAKNPTTRAKL